MTSNLFLYILAASHDSWHLPKHLLARSGYVKLVLVAMALPPIAPPHKQILEANPIWNLHVGPTRSLLSPQRNVFIYVWFYFVLCCFYLILVLVHIVFVCVLFVALRK